MSEFSVTPQDGSTQSSNAAQGSYGQAGPPPPKPSLALALLSGFLASVVGAVVWGGITYVSGYKLGLVAIGVGFVVGYAVRYFGNGSSIVFGMIGAFFAVFGCVLGNILAVIAAASLVEHIPLLTIAVAFLADPLLVFRILQETFSIKDIIFYGIAIYEGFRFSMADAPEPERPVSLGLHDHPSPQPSQSYSPPPPPPPEANPGSGTPAVDEKKMD